MGKVTMKKLLAVAAIFVSAIMALVWVGVASAIPIVTIAELGAPANAGSEVEVKDGKVEAIESIAPLRFTVTSRTGGGTVVRVSSPRTIPDNFKVGIDVGLRGTYNAGKNVFDAYNVTTKCPSKYEASKDAGGTGGAYGSPGGPAADAKI